MIQDDDDGWCENEAIPREKKIEHYVFKSFYLMHVRMKVNRYIYYKIDLNISFKCKILYLDKSISSLSFY